LAHLQLHAAICLQPLHRKQIKEYAAAGGRSFAGLRKLLQQDAEMQELAQSPLMLSIMSLAYQNVPVSEVIVNTANAVDKRNQLFDKYIAKMFARRPNETKQYAQEKTVQRLAWLAAQMQQRGQSEFLVEKLQPDWMPSSLGYQLLNGTFWGLFAMGLGAMMTHDLSFSLTFSMLMGFIWAIFSGEIKTKEALGWSWEKFSQEWRSEFLFIMIFSIIVLSLFSFMTSGFFAILFYISLYDLLQSGLENQIPERKSMINNGIVSSFYNMMYFGIPFGIIMGVILWIGLTTLTDFQVSVVSLIFVLFSGILAGILWLGGEAVVQHFILRLTLWLEGYTPFNLVHFLDHAAKLILLRKVGGGYVFIHRLVLEHFAGKLK